MTPSWWADGVRVVNVSGIAGEVTRTSAGWMVKLDGEEAAYVPVEDPCAWRIEVRQGLTAGQLDRVLYDAERALVRGFGCHYVPEWEALPDSMRAGGAPRPRVVNRSELDGLRAVIRGALREALAGFVR